MEKMAKLKSTDCTQTRQVTLAQVQKCIRLQGGAREKTRPAAFIALSDGSTNVLNVFDTDKKFICAIGWYHDRKDASDGLSICG